MVAERTCRGISNRGKRCRTPRLRDSDYCVFHDPEHAEAVQEGRRRGGLRRRKEGVLAAALNFEGLSTIEELQRLLEILEALGSAVEFQEPEEAQLTKLRGLAVS